MKTLSVAELPKGMDPVLEKVCKQDEALLVTRKNGDGAVILPLAEYRSMKETLYLKSSPENIALLDQSIRQLREGKVQERDLIDP